jgi:hypothetical protein
MWLCMGHSAVMVVMRLLTEGHLLKSVFAKNGLRLLELVGYLQRG